MYVLLSSTLILGLIIQPRLRPGAKSKLEEDERNVGMLGEVASRLIREHGFVFSLGGRIACGTKNEDVIFVSLAVSAVST